MTDQPKKEKAAPDEPRELVAEWWIKLVDDRGARAELRRAKTLTEIALTPTFHTLYRRLGASNWRDPGRIALVAGVLAQVDTDNDRTKFAEQLAQSEHRDKAPMSGLRFRRLLQQDDADALFIAMRRAVLLLNKKANVRDLATGLYYWNSDRTRREWALAYYDKAPAES